MFAPRDPSGNGARLCQGGVGRTDGLAGKRIQSITGLPSSGKSTRTTREHIMMHWNFQTGRLCFSLTCSKVRKQQCSSFLQNPLPQPRRRPRHGSRTSANSQVATLFGPPLIERPIFRAGIGLSYFPKVPSEPIRENQGMAPPRCLPRVSRQSL